MHENRYTVGGTVPPGALYIERTADAELMKSCLQGELAYILTSRQMGKSSLMVRTASKLRDSGILPIVIDLTSIGVLTNEEQWYLSILDEFAQILNLKTDLYDWWGENSRFGVTRRFVKFMTDVILNEIPEQIVVFVDEIDTVLSLTFTDDFFSSIRFLYTNRSQDPRLSRLSFVLIGVASPTELIRSSTRTPFNVGRRIELSDFTIDQVLLLSKFWNATPDAAKILLDRIVFWTNGHPYLTQKLCVALHEQYYQLLMGQTDHSVSAEDLFFSFDESTVDSIVGELFFERDRIADDNLRFVANLMLSRLPKGIDLETLFSTYTEVYFGVKVQYSSRLPVHEHLRLSGIVKVLDGNLVLRNELYRKAFGSAWIDTHRPRLVALKQVRRLTLIASSSVTISTVLVGLLLALVNSNAALESTNAAFELTNTELERSNIQLTKTRTELRDANEQKSFAVAQNLKILNEIDSFLGQIEVDLLKVRPDLETQVQQSASESSAQPVSATNTGNLADRIKNVRLRLSQAVGGLADASKLTMAPEDSSRRTNDSDRRTDSGSTAAESSPGLALSQSKMEAEPSNPDLSRSEALANGQSRALLAPLLANNCPIPAPASPCRPCSSEGQVAQVADANASQKEKSHLASVVLDDLNSASVETWHLINRDSLVVIDRNSRVLWFDGYGKRLAEVVSGTKNGSPRFSGSAVTSDGQRVVVAMDDKVVLIDSEQPQMPRVIYRASSGGTIFAVSANKAGSKIAVVEAREDDTKVRLITVESGGGIETEPLSSLSKKIRYLSFGGLPEVLVGASYQGQGLMWNLSGPSNPSSFDIPINPIRSIGLSPKRNLVAVGDLNGKVSLWNPATSTQVAVATDNNPGPVSQIVWSTSGDLFAALHVGGAVDVWRVGKDALFREQSIRPSAEAASVSISKDDKYLLRGFASGTAELHVLQGNFFKVASDSDSDQIGRAHV